MAEFSLVQLRHFCAVAELGSIAEAARQRHVSATAVGTAITNLEAVLGTSLCLRERSRGVTLTAGGWQFYREARRILRSVDDLMRMQPVGSDELVGPLRVGAFRTLAAAVLPPLLVLLERERPDLKVEFTTGPVLDLVELMVAGDLHCFFSYDVFAESGGIPPGLAVERLYPAELHVLLSSEHPLASRPHLSLDDLQGEPRVVFESNPSRRYSRPPLDVLRAGAQVRYHTSDYDLMRAMVGRALGYALVMSPAEAGSSLDGRALTKIPLFPALERSSVVAVYPEGHWQHPASRVLTDAARRLVTDGDMGASL